MNYVKGLERMMGDAYRVKKAKDKEYGDSWKEFSSDKYIRLAEAKLNRYRATGDYEDLVHVVNYLVFIVAKKHSE